MIIISAAMIVDRTISRLCRVNPSISIELVSHWLPALSIQENE